MWLLDANMPVVIADVLWTELGIEADTTESRGWKALKNGDLVEAAVLAGFTVVLTRDRSFSEAAVRALRRFPQFAVVLVQIAQQRGPQFADEFRRAWAEQPIVPLPGQRIVWPAQS